MHKQENAPKMQQRRAGGEALTGHKREQLAAPNIPAELTKHATHTNLELPEPRNGPRQAGHLWVKTKS